MPIPPDGIGRRALLGAAVLTGAGLAAGCSRAAAKQGIPVAPRTTIRPRAKKPAPARRAVAPRPPDPRSVRANELGMVPVLMHHRIVDEVDSEYDMTPAYFRAELERLRRENYHPIRTCDLATRAFRVPAGKTPCVITFDDGSPGQFRYLADGRVDPRCAVGILQDFHAQYPDFPAVASFYINKQPFGASGALAGRMLRDLHRRGFEIGNHTYDHVELDTLSSAQVQAELARLARLVRSAVPGYTPRTMALPLGVKPSDNNLAVRGRSGGMSYHNDAVLLVGANPSHSPYHREFDAAALPRIRCSSYQGGNGEFLGPYWLDYLARHPDQKYVSAANPGHITAPRAFADVVAPAFSSRCVWY